MRSMLASCSSTVAAPPTTRSPPSATGLNDNEDDEDNDSAVELASNKRCRRSMHAPAIRFNISSTVPYLLSEK